MDCDHKIACPHGKTCPAGCACGKDTIRHNDQCVYSMPSDCVYCMYRGQRYKVVEKAPSSIKVKDGQCRECVCERIPGSLDKARMVCRRVCHNTCPPVSTRPNRRFPSCLSPLFQSESQCEAFYMEISFIHTQIYVYMWQLGNRLFNIDPVALCVSSTVGCVEVGFIQGVIFASLPAAFKTHTGRGAIHGILLYY